ncbi:MAG: polymer-forming cytoskeletal protein [Ignavibacteriae bacterium]|nr:polymer-forming cytoskeletal protein [Ignavibacteria bacterium]MBI3365375.1 polymer-forming cytoskeletal protein [Ignavibacteriota bacterium]
MATKDAGSDLNLIAAGTVFEGKLRTPGSIRVDGRIVGEVMATQNVSIGSGGDIDGNVSAKNITVGGKTNGTIIAQEKLILESSAVVRGDIKAAKLVVNEGAVYDGRCSMSDAKAMPNLVELKQDTRRAAEER